MRILLKDIWFKYPETKEASLRGINLSISQGEILLVKGVSGSGKTTLLKIILGILQPQRGEVTLVHNDVKERIDRKTRLEIFGYLPQDLLVPEYYTPLELIKNLIPFVRRGSVEEGKALLERLEIPLNRPIENLSLGQIQRVAIVRALLGTPPFVLLDEPTSHLGRKSSDLVTELLSDFLSSGSGLIISTHDLTLIRWAKRLGAKELLLE